MTVELLLRGYPSRVRFKEWQIANSLPENELGKLSEDQRTRARSLHIPDRAYAVALKAKELSAERAIRKMEEVAQRINEAVKTRDGEGELKSVVWDFYGHSFQFITRHALGEYVHSIPTQVVDDVLLEKEGASRRLREAVDFELGGWAD